MKTPKELYSNLYDYIDAIDFGEYGCSDDLINLFKEFQKEAYNQALEDAYQNALIYERYEIESNSFISTIDEDSILKLKK